MYGFRTHLCVVLITASFFLFLHFKKLIIEYITHAVYYSLEISGHQALSAKVS